MKDAETRYDLDGYSTTESPDWLRNIAQSQDMPGGLTGGNTDVNVTLKIDARPKRILINAKEDSFCSLDSKN